MKNPILQIQYMDNEGVNQCCALPASAGIQKTHINNQTILFHLNARNNGIIVYSSARDYIEIPKGQKKDFRVGNVSFKFSCKSDFIKGSEDRFRKFMAYSGVFHIIAIVAIGLYIAFAPQQKIVFKQKTVNVDIERVKALMEKMKKPDPKPKKIVEKPKPKPKKIVEKPKPKPKKIVEKPKPKKAKKLAKKPLPKNPSPKKVAAKPAKKKFVAAKKKARKAVQRASSNNISKTKRAQALAAKKAKIAAAANAKKAAVAQAKKQLAQSMNFLATSPSKFSFKGNPGNTKEAQKKYGGKVVGLADTRGGKSSVLGQMADKEIDGKIETKGSRNMAGSKVVSDRKLLNGVTGKVSTSSLYSGESALSVSSLGGQGLTMNGSGQIAQSEIEKLLAKHMDNFRYCYEKALLSDASLGGNVMMKWTIVAKGSVQGVGVVKSQISNKKMQGCISREITKIRFPKPTGGSVTINYPFHFESSSI